MAFFTVAFWVLIVALGAGFAVSIVVFVPLFIYVIPYSLWIGNEQLMGRQKDKKKEPFMRSVRNATKLYGAWIRHKKPIL